jgi:hypothetical protein
MNTRDHVNAHFVTWSLAPSHSSHKVRIPVFFEGGIPCCCLRPSEASCLYACGLVS